MIKHVELCAFSWPFHVQLVFDEQAHFLTKKLLRLVFPPG